MPRSFGIRGLLPLADIPVIVFTAQSEESACTRAMAAGADMFFEKTVDKDELMAAIWGAVEGKQFPTL